MKPFPFYSTQHKFQFPEAAIGNININTDTGSRNLRAGANVFATQDSIEGGQPIGYIEANKIITPEELRGDLVAQAEALISEQLPKYAQAPEQNS